MGLLMSNMNVGQCLKLLQLIAVLHIVKMGLGPNFLGD